MGYHAPNAEDVYRYIFRLEKRSRSGLSDGFSWSILFVNDSSSVCRDFLARYGAEISYRTADRIRFVFFSGLSNEELQQVANRANRHGGFLSSIINAIVNWTSRRRRYDWERDNWEEFRPQALYPMRSQEHIGRQIDLESEMHSAMPGSEQALHLAQTLGIGRFVPCFILFSDVGNPTVGLFPIAHRSPEQVFERLRRWVDSFYEINHTTLTRWKTIEKSIEEVCGKLSLDKVEAWKREQGTRWKALEQISRYLNRLAKGQPNTALLREIVGDWNLPWDAKNMVSQFLLQLETSEAIQQKSTEVMKWFQRVREVSDPQTPL